MPTTDGLVLPPLPQEYYEDNRTNFDASTTITDFKINKCNHLVERQNDDLVCKLCGAGWPDLARFVSVETFNLQTHKSMVETTLDSR